MAAGPVSPRVDDDHAAGGEIRWNPAVSVNRAWRPRPRTVALHDCVAPRRFTEPLRAQLRRPFLRLEVDIDDPEAVAVAVNPFEIVLGAPEKVPTHRYSVGSCTLQLREVGAQEHDPV